MVGEVPAIYLRKNNEILTWNSHRVSYELSHVYPHTFIRNWGLYAHELLKKIFLVLHLLGFFIISSCKYCHSWGINCQKQNIGRVLLFGQLFGRDAHFFSCPPLEKRTSLRSPVQANPLLECFKVWNEKFVIPFLIETTARYLYLNCALKLSWNELWNGMCVSVEKK